MVLSVVLPVLVSVVLLLVAVLLVLPPPVDSELPGISMGGWLQPAIASI